MDRIIQSIPFFISLCDVKIVECMKILVVEDDDDIRTLISFNLEKEGHEIKEAKDGKEAIELFDSGTYQAVLLDILIPEVRGTDVLKHIRSVDGGKSTVLMVSALEDDQEIIDALENGADDYITKPFSPRYLIAKLKTIERLKNGSNVMNASSPKGLEMDKVKRKCTYKGKDVKLKETEFEILFLLLSFPEKVFTRKELIGKVRGNDYYVVERSVDVQMTSLRKKIGELGKNIETVWGIGYRWTEKI